MRSRLRTDKPVIAGGLFRPSGPLGSFSAKIDHAYLSRILSDTAYKDLIILKNVRNDFAHDLELDSFDLPSIRDRCKNFGLVDRHVGPIPSAPSTAGAPTPQTVDMYLGLPDYQQKLADPRFRYVMTAQIISYQLGEGSEREDAPLPLV